MAQRAQPVRGMRDIVPPEAELRRQVANRILDVYAGYGYEVIETPAFEDLDVLMGSDGGDNEKLIFKVLKRGARLEEASTRENPEAGELADAGLRFDLTVPLARFVANHLNDLPMPFKVFVYLDRKLTPQEELAVNSLGIPGVYFENNEKRHYPDGDLAAHILGGVKVDSAGVAGGKAPAGPVPGVHAMRHRHCRRTRYCRRGRAL